MNIGIIGAGFMGSSIGLALKESFPNYNITISDIDKDKLNELAKKGLNTLTDNIANVNNSEIIILAVKPNIITRVMSEIRKESFNNKLIISIAAGIPIKTIDEYLPKTSIIRVMPNINAQIHKGAIAYAKGKMVTEEQSKIAQELLSTIGMALCVEENMLDAVTGLSGSGPAFVFMAIEALSDGGVLCGLPRNISNQLAAQTVLGSAEMYLQTGKHAGALKDMVTSPGGTTIKGVQALEDGGFRSALIKAVEEAYKQSKSFSK